MIVDLHAHTNFSKDAADDPEELIKKMIESGVQVFGITDHNHWIKGIEKEQNAAIRKLAEKYKDKIKIYCGIELSTRPSWELCDFSVPKAYDYALIENVDEAESVTGGDLFGYAEKAGIPCGVAHTDTAHRSRCVKRNFAADEKIDVRLQRIENICHALRVFIGNFNGKILLPRT